MTRVALDLTCARDNLYAFGKLWGYYGNAPVIGVFHGTIFGLVGTQKVVPLFGYVGTGVTKMRVLDNGDLQMRGKETNFITDLQTGKVLDNWYNPYTNETVQPYHFVHDEIGAILGQTMERMTVGDSQEAASLPNEATATHMGEQDSYPFVMPWQVYGDEVLLEWDYMHAYTNPVTPALYPHASSGDKVNPSEHFTLYTSLKELEDRSLDTVLYRGSFCRVAPWFPWMRMGQSGIDGYVLGRFFSRKVSSKEQLPPALREHIENHHPESLIPRKTGILIPLKAL